MSPFQMTDEALKSHIKDLEIQRFRLIDARSSATQLRYHQMVGVSELFNDIDFEDDLKRMCDTLNEKLTGVNDALTEHLLEYWGRNESGISYTEEDRARLEVSA